MPSSRSTTNASVSARPERLGLALGAEPAQRPAPGAARSSRSGPAACRAHPTRHRTRARAPGSQSSHKESVQFAGDRFALQPGKHLSVMWLSGLRLGRGPAGLGMRSAPRCKGADVAIAGLNCVALPILGGRREIMRRLFSAREAGGWRAAASPARAHPGLRSLALAALRGSRLAACAETITKHGHLFQENDLAQISPGMSSEQVRTAWARPRPPQPSATAAPSTISRASRARRRSSRPRRRTAAWWPSISARWARSTALPSTGSRTARCSTTSRTRRRALQGRRDAEGAVPQPRRQAAGARVTPGLRHPQSTPELREPFSPWGEGARRADEGASLRCNKSPLTSSAR